MNYIAFCNNYFHATGIPVSLLKAGHVEYSALGEMLSITPQSTWQIFPTDHNPGFVALSPDLEYGRVQIENTDYDLILGPAFNVPVTESLVRQFMHELATPLQYRDELMETLCSLPRISHLQFAHHLSLIHLCLNQKEADPLHFYIEDNDYTNSRNERQLSSMIDDMENDRLHNTYYFEQELYQYVRNGSPEKLKDFLISNKLTLKEGKMAGTPLRNAKNLFIATTTKVGMLGAIPGGVNVETTYQLIDFYTQECEQLQSIDEVNTLQYIMLMDFCKRAGETQIPEGISQEVYQCVNYIRSHTNEPVCINDVAEQIHRSSSYIMKRFKEELGIHIGAFITRCKLEEAKSLLTYSDKSLAEISSYLCFSSQSYFQNVFKKQYGVTPMQYRKNRDRNQ